MNRNGAIKQYFGSVITAVLMCVFLLCSVITVHAETMDPYNVQIVKRDNGSYAVTFDGEFTANDEASLFIYKDGVQVDGISCGKLKEYLNEIHVAETLNKISVAMVLNGEGVYNVGVRIEHTDGKYSAVVKSQNSIVYNNSSAPKLNNVFTSDNCYWDLEEKTVTFCVDYGMNTVLSNDAFYYYEFYYTGKRRYSGCNRYSSFNCEYLKDGNVYTLRKEDNWVPGVYEIRLYVCPKDPNVNSLSEPAIGKLVVGEKGEMIFVGGENITKRASKNGIIYENGEYHFYVKGNFLNVTGLMKTTINGVTDYYYLKDGVAQLGYTGTANLRRYNAIDGFSLESNEYIDYYIYNGRWVEGPIEQPKNGIVLEEGIYKYYVNNVFDTSFNGIVEYNGNWWYVNNGVINLGYDGFVQDFGLWWCVAGGRVAFDYTGLWSDANIGWWYVKEGRIDFTYDGLVEYCGLWWCVAGGRVAFEYTGLWSDAYVGNWFVRDGHIDFTYNGFIENYGLWWCVADGRVAFEYTGLWNDANVGWWFVRDGHIDFTYNGFVEGFGYWWCIADGRVAFEYTGLWFDANIGWWFVNGGMIDFNAEGTVEYLGNYYYVSGGRLV